MKETHKNLNTDMRKFGSTRKDESRAQSADSSKAYGKPRAFICCLFNLCLMLKLLHFINLILIFT